jgi:hypothetical protein
MTEKFNRCFSLKIEVQPRGPTEPAPTSKDAWAEIELPYTLEFSVVRSLLGSANTASFRIYNLAPDSRRKIYKDRYNFVDYRACQFSAGYNGNMAQIFNGNVIAAWSRRESGAVDVITEIQAQESYAMVNAFTNRTIAAQAYRDVMMEISKDFLHMDRPIIGALDGESTRQTALFGPSWKIAQAYKGDATLAIDNNRLIALRPDECIVGTISEVSAETGLLGAPYRSDTFIEFEMIFTPEIQIGQAIILKSITTPIFNKKPYRVAGFTHVGTISDAVCGAAKTTVQLQAPLKEFVVV